MSKRIRAAAAATVVLLLIAIHLSPVAQQPARTTGIEPAPVAAGKSNEFLDSTHEILEEVSRMRGLKILTPVKSGVKSRTEIEREIIRNFEESLKPEELRTINKTLIAYGLVPKDFDYREFMIKLMTEQVAGFYRPKSKELFIADWNELSQQKPVMAHELTHALQDQHFNLRRFEEWPSGDGDREMAIHALIEGDATDIMYNYQLKPMKTDISRLPNLAIFADQTTALNGKDDQKVYLSAPPAIRESLIFPYIYGASFVQELVKEDGWDAVSRAFTDLPQSTEQIIHFEKYRLHEEPIKVRLADLTSILGPDWKQIDADINGEFGYFLILSEYVVKREARKAAEGWGGDQSVLYEHKRTGELLLVHLSKWDSLKDAGEFFQAYAKRTLKRYPQATLRRELSAREHHFQTPDGDVFIQWRDQSVLVVEGLPSKELDRLNKLTAALWKH
ncbi:MAG TPA: hypothetical protein VJ302_13825 [Blastocatellia bacterium]|nr:hypothetical protein [Blastocatellia bacterium]